MLRLQSPALSARSTQRGAASSVTRKLLGLMQREARGAWRLLAWGALRWRRSRQTTLRACPSSGRPREGAGSCAPTLLRRCSLAPPLLRRRCGLLREIWPMESSQAYHASAADSLDSAMNESSEKVQGIAAGVVTVCRRRSGFKAGDLPPWGSLSPVGSCEPDPVFRCRGRCCWT